MAKANMTRSSHTNLNRDFKPCLSSLFLCTIPIFQGSQNNPMKIQEDKDANTWMKMQKIWRLWTLHISLFSWVSIFFSHQPFLLQCYHFFHHPSPEELSLDIILGLSQSFFVIQQVYTWVNQILDSDTDHGWSRYDSAESYRFLPRFWALNLFAQY